jgi:hypothetical protein
MDYQYLSKWVKGEERNRRRKAGRRRLSILNRSEVPILSV